jgi:hypothetical protein
MKTKPFQDYLENRLSPEEICEIENQAIEDLKALDFIEKGRLNEGSTFELSLDEYGILEEVKQFAENKIEQEYKKQEKEFFIALVRFVKYKLGTHTPGGDNELLNKLLTHYHVFKKIMIDTQSKKN